MAWYIKLVIGLSAGIGFWVGGMLFERANLTELKGEVKGAASAQNAAAKIDNKENKGEANVSQTQYLKDLQAVHDYYAAHPVIRMRVEHGACIVSGASDNPASGNEPAGSMFATTCNPEDATAAAVTLASLQARLRAAAARGAVSIQ